MNFAFTYFFLFLIAHAKAQKCSLLTACPDVAKLIPECKTDINSDAVYTCVLGMSKHEECKNRHDVRASVKLVEFTNDAFCKDKTLNGDFKKIVGENCYDLVRNCANDQIALLFKNGNEDKCTQHRKILEECMTTTSKTCKEISRRYADAAYAKCGASNNYLNHAFLIGLVLISYFAQFNVKVD